MRSNLVVIFLIIALTDVNSQSGINRIADKILLLDIKSNIEKYKQKTVTMKLKLKYVDNIFEKIVFYDRKNSDIEFDISSQGSPKHLKWNLLDLHEGLDYYVTFRITGVGNLNQINAELVKFTPCVLDKIP